MNEQIEAIRSEIKRLEEIHERNLKKPMERGRIGFAHGVVECCDRILSFIDSLPEETDNEEPNRPMISDSLEEAAEKYEKGHTYQRYDGGGLTPEYDATLAEAFIAGAQWMAGQGVILNLSIDEFSCGAYNACVEQGLTSEDDVIVQIRKA